MGALWAQEASKPAPGALRDASSTAKDPSRGAKRLPRASRDPPKIDFEPPRGRLGVDFDPPKGPRDFKNCIQVRIPAKRLHLPLHSTIAGSAGARVSAYNLSDPLMSRPSNLTDISLRGMLQ